MVVRWDKAGPSAGACGEFMPVAAVSQVRGRTPAQPAAAQGAGTCACCRSSSSRDAARERRRDALVRAHCVTV